MIANYGRDKYGKQLFVADAIPFANNTDSSTASVPTVAKGGYVIVNVSAANIRTGASTKYRILGVARRGTKLKVVSKSGSRYKVNYGKRTGYIAGWLVRKG